MNTIRKMMAGLALVVIALIAATQVHAQQRAALPPANPFLIQNNSVYPSVHFDPAQTDTTSLPVWPGETKIEPSQVQWLPGLTTIGTVHRPYEGGEQAMNASSKPENYLHSEKLPYNNEVEFLWGSATKELKTFGFITN